jgi:hypothetical protein
MSRNPQTPAERFTAGMQAFSQGNPQGWLDQFTDDVVRARFLSPQRASHTASTATAAVADYLRAVPSRIQFESMAIHHVHQSVDPRPRRPRRSALAVGSRSTMMVDEWLLMITRRLYPSVN